MDSSVSDTAPITVSMLSACNPAQKKMLTDKKCEYPYRSCISTASCKEEGPAEEGTIVELAEEEVLQVWDWGLRIWDHLS